MKVFVDPIDATTVTVITRPSLLEKLLLRQREQDRLAVRVPAPNGGFAWHWDYGGAWVGQRIEREIVRAQLEVERKRAVQAWQRLWAEYEVARAEWNRRFEEGAN